MSLVLSVSTGFLRHGDQTVLIESSTTIALLTLLAQCQPGYVTDRMASRVRGGSVPYNRADGLSALHANVTNIRRAFARVGVPWDRLLRIKTGTAWPGYKLLEPTTLIDQYPLRVRACGCPVAGVSHEHLTSSLATHLIHT